jgi:predicted metal-dependent enzyme (double-stranded beta helix superfamily)
MSSNAAPASPPLAASTALSSVPRPRGRDLSAPELEAFVRELAERPELWIELVKHDASQRVYEELLSDAHLTAWLICWMDDQDTGFHDHDTSAGAVAVVGGRVREERLAIGGQPRKRTFAVGDSFRFAPADIHRVRHGGSDPAVTLHVYSPLLARMGAYVIDDDGVLARHTMPSSHELRPLRSAEQYVADGQGAVDGQPAVAAQRAA